VLAVGEVILLQSELTTVLDEARRQGVRVTAVHNHMLDDGPHFWVHWYATGAGPALARRVAAALAEMNGAHKATQESGE
jgi:hypothetical protein